MKKDYNLLAKVTILEQDLAEETKRADYQTGRLDKIKPARELISTGAKNLRADADALKVRTGADLTLHAQLVHDAEVLEDAVRALDNSYHYPIRYPYTLIPTRSI